MSFSTSSWFKRINSSCWTTSGKCFWLKTSAACIRSTQLCVSAKSRMPKQFDGSSWLSRNSQQACFTPTENWRGEWALHAYSQSTALERASEKKVLNKNENPTQITSLKPLQKHICKCSFGGTTCQGWFHLWLFYWTQSLTKSGIRKSLKCQLYSASWLLNKPHGMSVDTATRFLGFLQCLFESCLGFGILVWDISIGARAMTSTSLLTTQTYHDGRSNDI